MKCAYSLREGFIEIQSILLFFVLLLVGGFAGWYIGLLFASPILGTSIGLICELILGGIIRMILLDYIREHHRNHEPVYKSRYSLK